MAVVSAIIGKALARMIALPSATPVTGTVTLDAFPWNMTVAGTVATLELLEVRLMVKPPAGAFADKFKVTFCIVSPVIVTLTGKKLIVAVT